MDKDWSDIFMSCLGIIFLFLVLVAIGTLIGQWLWGWVVPDVFSSAVEKGILPASITFLQAFKLSLLVSAFVGASRSSKSSS